ncbi:MAG TPA: DNA translocase FtsK 4TM domain-containing protein [Methylomirabilota bacterium]|nr:DNA translocase FtsK 4TM domain-containing protein [Methylomirabilota bacterium]
MARRAAKRQGRGAVPQDGSRIRNEVAAIALVAFAVLSLVALFADANAVLLHWWRSFLFSFLGWGAVLVPVVLGALAAEMWFGLLRRSMAAPIGGGIVAYSALLALLQHYQGGDPAAGQGAGGTLGLFLQKLAAGAFGDVGTPIVLFFLFLVGVVIAANRTLAEMARPAWERRSKVAALRPGATLPGGTGARFSRELADEDEAVALDEVPAEPMRINLPPDRPKAPGAAGAAQKAPLRLLPPEPGSHEPSIAGLPQAEIAAEGVLHAKADKQWTLPALDLLAGGEDGKTGGAAEIQRNAKVIEETLSHFGIVAKVVEATPGPVVTRYELKPAAGVKLSRIEALNDDLALALAARTLRIEAPIPGKSVVGIEVPNIAVGLVSLRDVVETTTFKQSPSKLTVALGRDVAGAPIILDLGAMPHLLVAGQTGSGKSVSISSILCSLLLNATPDEVRILIGDMKRVDFTNFGDIPHLIAGIMTDSDKILNALYWATSEMDRRYRLFARKSARNIGQYNERHTGPDRIPYVVIVIDELADLMLQAPIQVEKQITRIAQLARATGIHLVLGTQRPSVDVITGLIKANIPARIAFATASAVDSRTILDQTGAEKLLGRGDMLVLRPDLAAPIRAQGVFVSDNEIQAISHHWTLQSGIRYDRNEKVVEGPDRLTRRQAEGDEIDDDRYEEAVEIVTRAGQASVSMLQRKMTVGFARAGRLIDVMEQNGVIGPPKGPGKMREVYGGPSPRAEDQG